MDIVGEYHGLRVGSALLGIVAGCIIIGVSRECDADAVGGIFLGAGGLGLLISIYPFIKAWLNINHVLPGFGEFLSLLNSNIISKANTVWSTSEPGVHGSERCSLDGVYPAF
uniref:Kinocilin n=1 Tax=Takifugu rubripes TaxID=31033 RepID=A0A674MD62_TAKRU